MDFRCVPVLFSLNLILITAYAALPPQIYWERMLPTTPMPKPIIELLNRGGFVSTEDVGKVTNEDQNPHIVEWGQSLDSQSEDKFPTTLYFSKKDLSQEEKVLLSYGIKKSEPTKTRSEDNFPLFYVYGIKKNEPSEKTRSEDDIPLFYSYGIEKNKPSEKTNSEDDVPLFYSYSTKKSELTQKTRSENDVPLFYSYSTKKSESTQKTRSENDVPLFYSYVTRKSEPTQKTRSENDFPLFYSYSTKKSEPTQKTRSENDVPLFYSYSTKKSEPTQTTRSENDVPLFYVYGVKKNEPSQKTHLKNDVPLFYSYGTKKGELAQKTLSADNMVSHSIIDTNSLVPKMSRGDVDKVTNAYQEAHHQVHNNANGLIPKMRPVSDDHQLHDHPKGNYIFMEEGLRPGSKLDVHFNKREHTTPLLPRHVAQRIPFTSENMKEILEIFSVEPESEIAEDVRKAIWYCEVPVFNGEEKHCATSLESMLDFIISVLGNNVRAMSTEVERETMSRKFTVKDGVKKLADENIIVCHPMKYPHMVFYCHHLLNTTAHFVPLEGEDGTRVKGVAVCHKDTSQWDPNHMAFHVLKIKPGDAPICHFLPQGHLMFAK